MMKINIQYVISDIQCDICSIIRKYVSNRYKPLRSMMYTKLWVWKLVSDFKGRTKTKGVWETIWVKRILAPLFSYLLFLLCLLPLNSGNLRRLMVPGYTNAAFFGLRSAFTSLTTLIIIQQQKETSLSYTLQWMFDRKKTLTTSTDVTVF
jgi:hypothetical protein